MGLLIISLWLLISPQSHWRATQSWEYRNPEANEPSDLKYLLLRITGGIGVVASLIALIVLAAAGLQGG